MWKRLRQVGDERGFALAAALGFMVVLGIAGTASYVYTMENTRSSERSRSRVAAYPLAQSGVQMAMSVLSVPSHNALSPSLLPACATPTPSACTKTTFGQDYVLWGGTLSGNVWTISSTGFAYDPAARTYAVHRIKATISVQPTMTQPLNNPAWNYIYATHPPTPGVCDEIIQQSVVVASPLYVNGNLCLQNTATIVSGPLDVKGSLTLTQKQNGVGTASAPIGDAHIVGGCQYQNGPRNTPCKGAADNVYAKVLDSTASTITPPVVYWDSWYQNSSPGPYFPCIAPSGLVPTFDNDQGATPDPTRRNNSIVAAFNLTPGANYSCKTAAGEISWNATTHVLTLSGTIFIDGSAYINNGAVNSYDGQATLYLSGTFLQKNSKLCAGLNAAKTDCDTSTWNPNTELLCIVAGGSGGQVNSWDSVQLVSSAYQGAIYAVKSIDSDTTSSVDGPMVGDAVNIGQSVTTSFPTITTVPVAMPANPTVYAQPQPPQMIDG